MRRFRRLQGRNQPTNMNIKGETAAMKRHSVFQAPFLAFGSGSLYRDVGRNWKGVAFGYLLLLL